MFTLLAFALAAPVCVTDARADAQWTPAPGARYFGVWREPDRFCEYVFDTADDPEEGRYRGRILLPGHGADQLDESSRSVLGIPFTLTARPDGAWALEWRPGAQGPVVTGVIDSLRTIQGQFLAGRFFHSGVWNILLIWPNPTADMNPFRDTGSAMVERIDSDEGDFRLWTAEDGLASNATRSIVQTADGYVWIGTVDGLSRFDGASWRTFGPDSAPRLPDNNIPSLLEDRHGRLVVGTKHEGIFRYDGSAFVPCDANDQLKRRRVGALAEDPDGSLWFTLDDGRTLGRLSPEDQFESWEIDGLSPLSMARRPEEPNVIGAIIPEGTGRVLLGVRGNVLRFAPEIPTTEYGLTFTRFSAQLAPAPDGDCWWFSERLFHLAPDLNVRASYNLPGSMEFSHTLLAARRSGTVWFTNWHPPFELFRFAGGILQRFPGVPEHYKCSVVAMMEDLTGNIWLATGAGGVGRFRPPLVETLTPGDGQIQSESFYSIAADGDGSIHYASTYAFVSGAPGNWNSLDLNEHFPRAPNDSFQGDWPPLYAHGALTLTSADGSEAWFGLERNKAARHLAEDGRLDPPMPLLARRRGEEVRLFYSDHSPVGVERAHAVARSTRNGIYLASDQGIFHLPNEASAVVNWNRARGLARFDAYCAFTDSRDRVWLGGAESGLYQVDGEDYVHFSVKTHGLASSSVLSIWEDEGGAVWIGGREGLSRIWPDGRVDAFRDGAGFLRTPIQAIVQDNERHFWLGTPNGIFGVPPGEFDVLQEGRIEELRIIRLGRTAGLQNENVYGSRFPAACRAPDGRLWFSMENGLARFDPAEVRQRYRTGPPARILRCQSGETVYFDADDAAARIEVDRHGRLQLPPEAGAVVAIDYTGMSFIDPERTRFQYRLSGVTSGWKDNGRQRSVSFTRLAPGDYQFEVRAIAPNHLSSSEPAVLAFSIAPYFYQTWAFRFALAAAIGGTVLGLHRWRLGYRERIKELEKQVELDAERSRIARDVHDDLGSALARIRMRCEVARELNHPPRDIDRLTAEIGDFAYACSKSLREIIWSLNPAKASYTDLADYVRSFIEDYFEGSEVRPHVEITDSASRGVFSPALKRDLILILKGIMSNVIQHAHATEFRLDMKLDNNALYLSASDNGCGFDVRRRASDSHGLLSLEERARAWNGELAVFSTPGQGTRIQVKIEGRFL